MPTMDAVAAALISAQPVLAATFYPPLLIIAGVAAYERHRLGSEPDDYRLFDDEPAVDLIPMRRRLHPVDAPTEAVMVAIQPVPLELLPAAPAGADEGAPTYARLVAAQVLRELGEQARMELAR